jgi:hypothetical protein
MSDPWSKFQTTLSPAAAARLDAVEAAEARPAPAVALPVGRHEPEAHADARRRAPHVGSGDEYPLRMGERLKGDWFPFYIDRFLSSRLVTVTPRDVAFTSVVLWAASMRQDPAGTLPDDDAELAYIAGCGRDMAEWADLKARGALRKWTPVLCLDPETDDAEQIRLAHPVVTEVAVASFERMRARTNKHAEATKRSDRSKVRKLMRDAGAHPGLTNRRDFVDQVIEDLRARRSAWDAHAVRHAMERLDAGDLRGVVPMRQRE